MMARTKLACIFLNIIWFGCTVECRRRFHRLKVLTYNAGLLDASLAEDTPAISNNREERRDALVKYLKKSNAELVCLQEVSFGQDVEKIVNRVRKKFPYSFSELHQSDGTLTPQTTTVWEPSCDHIALTKLFKCVLYNGCANGTEKVRLGAAVFQCMQSNCLAEFTNLVRTSGEKCLACLTKTSPKSYFSRCAGDPSTNLWHMNKLGLLLLSKKALIDTTAVEFYPEYVNVFPQGYIKAKVDGNNMKVVCAHAIHYLPITFEFPPVGDLYPTYADQNAFEMHTLVDRFASVEPLILLGDMNVGPGAPSVSPLGLFNYQILTSVFNTKAVKECTFCSTNPYTGGEFETNAILDHVLVNGDLKARKVKVVLKPDDFSLGEENLPLSDHFGVKAVVHILPKRRTRKMFK